MKKGFTLIELLVVIAIIALLLSIILPALRKVKRTAQATVCLANVKSISAAWFAYQNDNVKLVPSRVVPGQNTAWVQMPQDELGNTTWSFSDFNATLKEKIRGIERGLLHSYMTESYEVYHCPADKRTNFGLEAYRTYSMIGCLNGYDENTAYYDKDNKYHIQKFTSIKSPSQKYMLTEESDSRGLNNVFWTLASKELGYDPVQWWSVVAIWHGDSSNLGFCDGHAERHKWEEDLTKELAEKSIAPGAMYGQTPVPRERRTDIDYMERGWAY